MDHPSSCACPECNPKTATHADTCRCDECLTKPGLQSNMVVDKETRNGILVISLGGRFDSIAAAELGDDLVAAIDSGSASFLINMTKLTYLASAGIRILLTMLKKAKAAEKPLRLTALQPSVQEVLDMSGMLGLFEIV